MFAHVGGSRRHKSFQEGSTTASGERRVLTKLEETQMYQPRVPHPEAYEWPKGAPNPHDARREQYHEFMRGRPFCFTANVTTVLYRLGGFGLSLVLVIISYRILRPDDFQWVDEERKRLLAARKKLDRIKAQQERQRRLMLQEEENSTTDNTTIASSQVSNDSIGSTGADSSP